MSFSSEMSDAMTEMLTLMGSSWTAASGSVTFTGVMEDDAASTELQEGGLLGEDLFFLTAKQSAFATLPAVGTIITDNTSSTTYRIKAVVTSQGDPGVRFVLHNRHRA